MERLTGMEWLKKRIKRLEITNSQFKDVIEQIKTIKPDVCYESGAWTPLKLILLDYALYVCTTIIKTKSFFKKRYYVDLFSGSGLNKIKEVDDFLIGSPLVASLNYAELYDLLIFCENNIKNYEALDLRLKNLKRNNLLVRNSYSACLDEFLSKLKDRNTYSFIFADPFSTEFSWLDMKRILGARSDILFTFMSSELFRAVGLAKAGKSKGEALTKMFGDESWKEANSAEELMGIYIKNILRERSEAPIVSIKIKSDKYGGFCYHMLFITNKTSGGNDWLKAINKAKQEIESNSDLAVEKALDIVKKRQAQISDF